MIEQHRRVGRVAEGLEAELDVAADAAEALGHADVNLDGRPARPSRRRRDAVARRGAGDGAARARSASAPGARARCARRSTPGRAVSIARMSQADGSSSQRPQAVGGRARERVVVVVPRLAERRQRQPETLVEWSSMSKRRRPKKWQTELIDHVTWWTKKTRTRPPQSSPVSAPVSAPGDQAAERSAGSASPSTTSHGNARLIAAHPAVLHRGRAAYLRLRGLPLRRSSSQPMCACHEARAGPSRAPTCGLCGSPSSSEWAWCLRWSATQ